MSLDTLEIFGKEYTNVKGFKAKNDNAQTLAYIRPQGTKQITANGTGIDVMEYASVDVSVEAGTDMPIFTVIWDDDFENILSVSCDKTYNECYNFIFNVKAYAEVIESNQEKTEEYYAPALCLIQGSNYIVYTVMYGTMPSYDIQYNSNGTFSVTNPSTKYEILNVTENGTYYPESGVISEVNVNVQSSPPQTQTKNVTPSETAQVVTPDNGYYLSEVDVGAISGTYVGSQITRRSSSDLTASGATVSVPAGYYESAASKIVASGSATTPASISGTAATVSTGTNTLTLSKTISVTPSVTAGYISSGTSGNTAVSLQASITTKAAETYTPTTSQQTIAANQYLTGIQTIAAIPSQYKDVSGVTAAAGDVVSGKSIVTTSGTVNGTLIIQHYYTGSNTPSSSLGENGDIYLKTS